MKTIDERFPLQTGAPLTVPFGLVRHTTPVGNYWDKAIASVSTSKLYFTKGGSQWNVEILERPVFLETLLDLHWKWENSVGLIEVVRGEL